MSVTFSANWGSRPILKSIAHTSPSWGKSVVRRPGSNPDLRQPRRAIPPQQPLELADLGLEDTDQVTLLLGGHRRIVFPCMHRLVRNRRERRDVEEVGDPREHGGGGRKQFLALEND